MLRPVDRPHINTGTGCLEAAFASDCVPDAWPQMAHRSQSRERTHPSLPIGTVMTTCTSWSVAVLSRAACSPTAVKLTPFYSDCCRTAMHAHLRSSDPWMPPQQAAPTTLRSSADGRVRMDWPSVLVWRRLRPRRTKLGLAPALPEAKQPRAPPRHSPVRQRPRVR